MDHLRAVEQRGGGGIKIHNLASGDKEGGNPPSPCKYMVITIINRFVRDSNSAQREGGRVVGEGVII